MTTDFSLREWRARASRYFRRADLQELGAGIFQAGLDLALQRDTETGSADGVEGRDPELVELVLDLSRFVGERWFRYRVEGVEHVPEQGAALLVGSHNGGLQTFDSLLTLVAIRDRYGIERAVHPLAHDLLFQRPRIREITVGFGALRADHGAARAALQKGRLVLVYPGSDLDSTRPFRDRHRIELGGRTGFLKLALAARVPIVPVVSVGTHEQFIVLTRGDSLARMFSFKRHFRAEVFPIVLSLPWGITSGFLPYLPLPAQTTVRFGAPIAVDDWPSSAADDPHALRALYERVRERMQAELDVLSAGRVPFLGRWPGR
ncbi:MAG: lysophospholipid acyltransferase family protein [Polyangiaceae bacterium]